jgi:protein-L-isoaspartate(D-aspartate) O-methyltransferase
MENFNSARHRYAALIQQQADLRSKRLVRALSQVPRENFLSPGPWKIMRFAFPLKYEDTPDTDLAHLYDNVLVAIDPARGLNNGLPSAVARSIDAMDIQQGEHVVHAGCGTGYYTAIIAHMVGRNGRVKALEFDIKLAERALTNLRYFAHVEVVAGDATKYDPGPVDAILVSAGATHPCALWLDSLKLAGRLVFPLVHLVSVPGFGVAGCGVMMRITRLRSGYAAQCLAPAGYFLCFGGVDLEADRRLGDALANNGLIEARTLRREPHTPDESCLLHGEGYCFSKNNADDLIRESVERVGQLDRSGGSG